MPLPTPTFDGCFQNPAVDVSIDCAPSTVDGKITDLFFGSRRFSSGEVADLSEFEAGIDNTDATGDYLHHWKVIASMAKPERGETQVEGGTTVYDTNSKYVITGRFYELSDARYNQIREMQAGKPMYVYFGNSQYLYGGHEDFKDGISTVISCNVIHPEDGKAYAEFTFSFENQYGPSRIAYPTDTGS